MRLYRIADAAKILGVSAQTLRRWDDKGAFKPLGRSEGGQRLYTAEQLEAKRVGDKSAPPSTCRELISVTVPAVLKAGPSQAAKERAKAYRQAKRRMIVGNILTRDSQRKCCRGKDRSAKLIDGDKVLDAHRFKCGAGWKWERPPTLQEAAETATLLQEAKDAYAATHGQRRLGSLVKSWDLSIAANEEMSLSNEYSPPLGLMIAKGRGIQAAEVRWWYNERASWQSHVWGTKGYEAAWAEIYIRIAYAWRLRDLLKRGL